MEDESQRRMREAYLSAKKTGQAGANTGGAHEWSSEQQNKRGENWGGGRKGNQNRNKQWGGGHGGGQREEAFGGPEEINMTVRNFLEDFTTQVTDKRVDELEEMFVKEYSKISDQIYKQKLGKSQRWPSEEEARVYLGQNRNVLMLYRELYYRHLFSKLDKAVTGPERVEAWENYQAIFDKLGKDLEGDANSLLKGMPISWLWDLLDEFVYHYVTYCQFKAKAAQKRAKAVAAATQQGQPPQVDQDFALVVENPAVFDNAEVFYTLKRLISSTNIDVVLRSRKGEQDAPPGTMPTEQAMYLGYFAKIQQLRYHIVLGEYDVALKCAQQLDFGCENAMYYRCPAAHVNLCYYVSFAFFMSGRYSDAVNIISKNLHFVMKLGRFPPLAEMYQLQGKVQDKMMRLLLLCEVFAPDNFYAVPEEIVAQHCNDKYADDVKVFKTWGAKDSLDGDMAGKPYASKLSEWFSIVSPRFVTPLDESAIQQGNVNPLEGHNRQWERFWQMMEEQKYVPMVGNVVRMYTQISIQKLMTLCNFQSEQQCRDVLSVVARKGSQFVIETDQSGQPSLLLPGAPQRCTDVDFTVSESGEVSVKILKPKKDIAAMYIKEIHRLETIAADIEKNEKLAYQARAGA
ncbi:unnamed protein product [Amoebophrya sp. A25]|nr:unnamed protein product [Amoebophrya sp. A25]|eukprot:GSA25T00005535001.1